LLLLLLLLLLFSAVEVYAVLSEEFCLTSVSFRDENKCENENKNI
jgi:hypothetical protein